MLNYDIEEINNLSDKEYIDNVVLSEANKSYDLNNKITEIFNSNSWINKPCFILAGGTSISNLDFSLLKDYLTIGINMSFIKYNTTINYSMDPDLYSNIYEGKYTEKQNCNVLERWNQYTGIRVLLSPMELRRFSGNNIYLIRRKLTPSVDFSDLDKGIYGGISSATGAINLALALGSRQIYLLGYDMQCTNKTHWHNGYPEQDITEFQDKLKRYCKEIENLSSEWESIGAKIVNLNRFSSLKCFKFDNLKNIF